VFPQSGFKAAFLKVPEVVWPGEQQHPEVRVRLLDPQLANGNLGFVLRRSGVED
jgi:hypothetical protein